MKKDKVTWRWFLGRFYFFLSTGRCFGSYFNSLWAVIGGYCSVQKRFKVPDPVGSQVLRALAWHYHLVSTCWEKGERAGVQAASLGGFSCFPLSGA